MNEEDIKNLNEIIELCEAEINNNDENVTAILDLTDLKSLRNLINRNKELEEIKDEAINTCFYTWNDDVELLCRKLAKYGYITIDKEKNEYISPFKDNPNLEESKDICEDISDYIPKSKVEEKIEELNKEEQELQNSISDEEREEYSDANISFDLMDIEIRRSVLEELLEE